MSTAFCLPDIGEGLHEAGLAVAVEVAADRLGLDLRGARVVVQGFGAVGVHAARFLAERGCILVAAADSRGAVAAPDGIDVDELLATKQETGTVAGHAGAERLMAEDLVGVESEIWIPAARPDVLRADNVTRLRTRIVAQGANIPATDEAETWMHANGVLNLPDFIANAGGVICGAVEYAGGTQADAFAAIDAKIRANTASVLADAMARGEPPRAIALAMAGARVRAMMSYRRFR